MRLHMNDDGMTIGKTHFIIQLQMIFFIFMCFLVYVFFVLCIDPNF